MLDPVIVGRVIRRFRERTDHSQEVISELAGIGRSHLSAIERGERRPTLDTFVKISQALGVGPGVIMNDIMLEMEEEENEKNKTY